MSGMPLDGGRRVAACLDVTRVLVADDQPDVRTALRLLMRDAGVEVDSAASVDEVRRKLEGGAYDLLLLDLNYARDTTSGREGLELLAEVHARDPLLPVVVMTGWGSIEMAVEAMRRGARGFVHKPWDNTVLSTSILREVEDGRAARLAERRGARERADAEALQRALLPSTLPAIEGAQLAAHWVPAAELGGDCYDAIPLDGGRLAITIGDVCGKGLPAALLMSNLQASVRAFASVDSRPHRVADTVNRALVQNSSLRRFVTFFYAAYDPAERSLTFANAGHNPPIVVSRDGSIRRLVTGGMVLGVFDAACFDEERVQLQRGDRVVMFTDGLVEAEDARGDQFGDDRVIASVQRLRAADAAGLVDGVFRDVVAFAGPRLDDDATAVVLAVQ